MYLYGDPAYTLSYGIIGAYKAQPNHPLNFTLRAVNTHMSSLRVSVEHGFGKTSNLWGFNTHGKNMKIGLSPVAGYYMVSILLANIHTCLYGSETGDRYNCHPPTIDVYLHL